MPAIALLDEGSALPFTAADHISSVNSLPSVFGQINADGLFPVEGLDTAFVKITVANGVIRALPATPGGRPSTIARHDAEKGIIFEIPNVSHEDSIQAVDVRKWQALMARSRDPETTLAELIERRHQKNRLKFDITREVMSLGALKGQITDGAGTVLYDLFDVFGLTQRVVFFDLDNANANVPAKIEELVGGVEDAAIDEVIGGVEVRVDPTFYNKLINHPSVQKFYLNTPLGQQLLNQQRNQVAGQFRRSIEIGGARFVEYRSKVTLWGAESPTALLAAGEGYANATGTLDTFATYAAPPLDVRELDGSSADVDDLIHMTTEIAKHGMGEEWKYQMNALPLASRPALTAKVSAGAS